MVINMAKLRIPKHIGIIPDGNRRWAANKGMKKSKGYEFGLGPGLDVLKAARKYGVEEITFYGFTKDNCKRPKQQVDSFTKACIDAIKLIADEDVSLLVIGDTSSPCFPKELLAYTTRTNINSGGIKVNFLVNYSWKWDLFGKKNGSIYSSDISRIDMIIRWGGRMRLSGFLPVQSVYSDMYVIEDMWPEYDDEHFDMAIKWYQKQDVTLGG